LSGLKISRNLKMLGFLKTSKQFHVFW